MSDFFPADVSLRVSGEISGAQPLFPLARQILSRAMQMYNAGSPLVRLFHPGEDGSLVYVYVHQGLKHVYVQPAPHVQRPPLKEVSNPQIYLTLACPDMLSGMIYPGTVVPTINEGETAIHAFHPTETSATAYELDFKWQDVTRLLATVRWPKPSMYSGAMKRLVQAMYGMGTVQRVRGEEDSEEAAVVDFPVENTYGYTWLSTDGIHKVGKTHWLIRISKAEGVLAMELPLFECTTREAFINAMEEIGDLDTFAVLSEFGGLPTGDNFPTGEDLEEAVKDGVVLQLLTPADILAFYQFSGSLLGGNAIAKAGYFANCGWAFSNTGEAKTVHNTCWWYSRQDISQADWWDGGWYFDGFMDAPAEDRFMRGEHWKVTLQLPDLADETDETAPLATLDLVEMQPVEAPNCWGLDTYGFPEKMAHWKKAMTGPPHYYEADEPYMPFGVGVYPGTIDLGYGPYNGFTGYTRFNQTSYGFEGDHRAGSARCLPWRSDIYSPPNPDGLVSEFHALTGPGFLSVPYSPRLMHCCTFYGFDPTRYKDALKTGFSWTDPNNAMHSHALFWTHRALMCVPQSGQTSVLDRFTFWGRSQCSIPIDEMEPAYAAPVHVFYIGEKLEIVYRQAERWKAGQYTMGDFWGTSLDLRMNSPYTTADYTSTASFENSVGGVFRVIKNYPSPEGHVGLVIPQGVREGYVLMRSVIGGKDTLLPNVWQPAYPETEWAETYSKGVFAVNDALPKIVEYTNYAWDLVKDGYSPNTYMGDGGLWGLLIDVQCRWDWFWTSRWYGPTLKFAVALNAQTGEFSYEHNGLQCDWNRFDHFYAQMISGNEGMDTPPPAVPRDGYPRYNFNLPPGIVLPEPPTQWGIDPVDITFIGGV